MTKRRRFFLEKVKEFFRKIDNRIFVIMTIFIILTGFSIFRIQEKAYEKMYTEKQTKIVNLICKFKILFIYGVIEKNYIEPATAVNDSTDVITPHSLTY